MTLVDRIKARIEALGTSAYAVSLKASGGTSKDVINNIYRGTSKNPRGDTLQKIAQALEVSVEWLLYGDESPPPPLLATKPPSNVRLANVRAPRRQDGPRDLPVQGTAAGSLAGGAFAFEGGVIDYVMRPPALLNVPDAYAIYVENNSMEPAHSHGDLRFVHPHRPVRPGDTVIIEARYTEDGPTEGFIKRLVRSTPTKLVVEQFNPPATIEFDKRFVAKCHKVLSMNDLFGV